ncbi:MAG: phenylacetate--CoA ligase [Candidatus Goldiibacteriota bacterium HGW-Goldbacteria-1]|jgi:phenylacetate-CoA ligase|nr:MAG: phenylacetate--CoA ligase [Candidatus Goldiibacteriota bacterium HGW-Goldbacteria-1]
MNYYSAEESYSRDQLKALQSERLIKTVERVYNNNKFYKKKMDDLGVKPSDIKSVDDIVRLPFTYKNDLRDNDYPYGMFSAPQKDVVRIHASSGTTGKMTVVGYTKNDIDVWATVMARSIAMAGGTPGDMIHNAYGYGLFTGGLGVHYGAEKLGATVIPVSGGNSQRQLKIMKDFGSTILTCTPSYALNLAETLKETPEISRKDIKLKAGIFGAEPWSENMRKEIEEAWGIDAVDIYGLSEIIGPGVANECLQKHGLHVYEDHFIPEIINPETGEPVKPGEKGELVFTTITKEAIPLLRYRTRDITRLIPEPCKCGRGLIRMERVSGRTDDMLIIRGVNVFPSEIEMVIMKFKGVEPHYQIIVDRPEHGMDRLEVQVEVNESMFSDEIKVLEQTEKDIAHEIHSVLGVSVKVKLMEPKTIARSEGKAKRIIDKRNL